jgi:hypothetical protein
VLGWAAIGQRLELRYERQVRSIAVVEDKIVRIFDWILVDPFFRFLFEWALGALAHAAADMN